MFCPQCGNKLPDDARFCPNCGCKIDTKNIYNVQSKQYQTLPIQQVQPAAPVQQVQPATTIQQEQPEPQFFTGTQPIASSTNENTQLTVSQTEPAEEKSTTIYAWEFLKSLASKDKIGIDIWLLINLVVIIVPLWVLSGSPGSLLFSLPIYLVSICLALSPVGEAILRLINHCKSVEKKDYAKYKERLTPLFNEVYEKAKIVSPSISKKIRLFVCQDPSPNAFATGRKTICVTEGLLDLNDEEIKGVLAHEFGHIAHKDTDIILVVAVGNIFVNLFLLLCRAFIRIFFTFPLEVALRYHDFSLLANLVRIIDYGFFFALAWIWTKIGVLLCLHSGRKDEYRADHYAVDIGYHQQLVYVLKKIDDGDYAKPKGLWASLNASHPDIPDRISSIEEYASENMTVSSEVQSINIQVPLIDRLTNKPVEIDKSQVIKSQVSFFCYNCGNKITADKKLLETTPNTVCKKCNNILNNELIVDRLKNEF